MARPRPLYKQIADTLIADIAAGRYPVGGNLPTEHQLLERLSVSRATIVAAFDQLEQLGLVYRRPRLGTQVISRFPMRSEIEEGSVFTDWAHFGVEYVLEIDAIRRKALPARAEAGAGRPGRSWLHVSGRRWSQDSATPICTVDVYVHPDYAGIEPDITRRPPRIFSLVEARYGIVVSLVDQELRAVRLNGEAARLLDSEPGTPAIEILRWYRGPKDKLVEFTIDIHPGDRFRYRTRTRRGPAV